jgi:hypothetical protein
LREESPPAPSTFQPRSAGPLAQPNPPAWHYDAVNNRHWDPGHNHWHDGPPPFQVGPSQPIGGVTQAQPQPAATPAPWEYDAANDRHWVADHGHWHDGPPPPEAARSNP